MFFFFLFLLTIIMISKDKIVTDFKTENVCRDNDDVSLSMRK